MYLLSPSMAHSGRKYCSMLSGSSTLSLTITLSGLTISSSFLVKVYHVCMTIHEWLSQAGDKLKLADIGTARLDALVLAEDETGRDRAWLLAHPDFELTR